MNITYTHKGWFGICPIYLGDIEGECNVTAMHDWLEWLMDVSEVLMGLAISVRCWLNPEYEPMFAMRVTGELESPIVRVVESRHEQ